MHCRISGGVAPTKNIHGSVSEQIKKNAAKLKWKVRLLGSLNSNLSCSNKLSQYLLFIMYWVKLHDSHLGMSLASPMLVSTVLLSTILLPRICSMSSLLVVLSMLSQKATVEQQNLGQRILSLD